MARPRFFTLCSLLLGACSHPPAPPTTPASDPSATPELSPHEQARALPKDASFADLVRAASLLDGSEAPSEPCLLSRGSDQAVRLAGPIRAGLRPLPQPALELDEILATATNVQVLTPWGTYGAGPSPLAFASLTAFPPLRSAVVLTITDRGVSLRGTDAAGSLRAELAPQVKSLSALGSLQGVVVFVAAEAAVPVREVYALLEELTRLGARSVLAVNLAPGTPLPAPAASLVTTPTRCPDGLSETNLPEGSLELNALLAGVEPLRVRAADCLERGGAEGAAGGKLTLALRIDARGSVIESCIQADELGDPLIASCVLELTRNLRFDPPRPTGVVDAELPLVLRPNSAPAPFPVCPPT